MDVPAISDFHFESDEYRMNDEQRAFYMKLEASLNNGEYVDIQGNVCYVYVYLRNFLSKWGRERFDAKNEFLIYLSELYKHEKKVYNFCLILAYQCLLELEKYEEFLDKTAPQQMFNRPPFANNNLRLNIQKKIGLKADPVDVLLLHNGGRNTNFISSNQALYKDKVKEVFNSFAEDQGGWFEIFEKLLPNGNIYQTSVVSG